MNIEQTATGFELQLCAQNGDEQNVLGTIVHNLEQGRKCHLTVVESCHAGPDNLSLLSGSIKIGRQISAKIMLTFE